MLIRTSFKRASAALIVLPALAVAAAAHDGGSTRQDKKGTEVKAPYTHVKTRGKRRTKVSVRAPYTGVDVDTRRRRVRINVPYFNRTIRW